MPSGKPQIVGKEEDVPAGTKRVDAYTISLKELFFIEHPELKKEMPEAEKALDAFLDGQPKQGILIYYPDAQTLVHTVPEETYFKIRTARNKNLITAAEQKNYRDQKVGIIGLSVGSAALSALVMSGGPKIMKISDFDTVEISNLNRLRASLLDVGAGKIAVAAREVWALDPFAELSLWEKGVDRNTLKEFILGEPKLDIFVDEMDSLELKILSRVICRENRIPVLMATDNGDGIIFDVERFDQEPERPIFHGLVADVATDKLDSLDYRDWLSLATKIVGPEYLTEAMQSSILEIGKSIAAVPQLGTTAALAGSTIAYAVRRIANKEALPSGRFALGLEEKLIPGYGSEKSVKEREAKTAAFKDKFKK